MTRDAAPPPKRGARDWETPLAKAKKTPGVWVEAFKQAPRSLPNAYTRGRINALKDPRWGVELITRNTNGSRADIWLRVRPWSEVEKDQAARATKRAATKKAREEQESAAEDSDRGSADPQS